MSRNLKDLSIGHPYFHPDKHDCGYCNTGGSLSNGMWAEQLTVEDYQNLIDRGWRRSGQYCYKPIMDQICCPQYTIRCDIEKFKASKSQKKVVKKFNKYLRDGVLVKDKTENPQFECNGSSVFVPDTPKHLVNCTKMETEDSQKMEESTCSAEVIKLEKSQTAQESQSVKVNGKDLCDGAASSSQNQKKAVKKGLGADPNRPPCKKAKLLRRERQQEKGVVPKNGGEKSLKDLLDETNSKLRITLVPTSIPGRAWSLTEKAEYELYKKYQMVVHNDPPDKCSFSGFLRFTVKSPLKPVDLTEDGSIGYGSFHQQYWIDDKLIAVGVIDILPKCISSVYFFYDPDYRNLTLGTYSSLREIDFTLNLQKIAPSIKYYYMGFYIHSCPKMRYKGKLSASQLLCPETYQWVDIEKCLPKIEIEKYARFNEDLDAVDEDALKAGDFKDIMVYADNRISVFGEYRKRRKDIVEDFECFANLIGKRSIRNFILGLSD